MVGLERMKFLDPLRFSSTIHFVESVQSLHTQTHPYVGTHAPLRSIICTTCVHTHTLPCTPLHTQLSHLHTHSLAAIYAPPVHTLTPTYKYLQISSLQLSQCLFTNMCKYPHCHTTVPII